MDSKEIREKFLNYFKSLNHQVFPSDSLIPSSDPTLLFTTAGMVQFKDYFLGKKVGITRACSVQKCLRTSDIEKVGHTFRHLTFFEMLGNFSFGDYFKKEAIEWAWEFITRIVNIDKNRLYITVYKDDDEAYDIWSKIVSKERIYKLSEETNFWKMGDEGPCGPCSEILYDLGEEYGCKKPTCSVACDCDRYLEVWNLVFTQYDLQKNGELKPLKQKNIDTGMGLERLCMVVNNLKNVFETDVFLPIKSELAKYISFDNNSINYINAIADHIRATTFAVSEGIIPTTEGRGYVVRKIVRRAVRYLKLLGYDKALLYKIVPAVVSTMKDIYPEVELHREKVSVIIKSEEEKFLETLDEGLKIVSGIIKNEKREISGETVFKLYDTYGFPKELIDEIFKENNISYDEKEFFNAEKKSKEISRSSWRGVKVENIDIYLSFPETNFVGYTEFFCNSKILGILKEKQKVNFANKNDNIELVVDRTPFYGESGGQIGDSGVILKNGKIVGEVLDTKKVEGRIVHIVKVNEYIEINDDIELKINVEKRKDIMRHHTATHLLHKALRIVLGEHALQSGSLVSDEYFRFDFVHWKSLTKDEIFNIEKIVNQKILECLPVSVIYTDLETAKKFSATALFEEKYKEQVRVVAVGGKIENGKILQQPYSIELCGGTHCFNTGEIGMFKIISESSVGANFRRIEAICGNKVYEYIKKLDEKLSVLGELVGTNNIDEIKLKVEKIIKQNKKLQQEIENIKLNFSSQENKEVIKEVNGIKYNIVYYPDKELKILRSISDEIIKKYEKEFFVLILYSIIESKKINIVIRTTKSANEKNLTSKKIAEILSQKLNIKLGGRDEFVQGGGNVEKEFLPEEILSFLSF
ncbi:MAG: alanine--tRNA ligase [Endomicrobiia bacterium]